jgi:prevent-host-death family protein
VTVTAKDLRFSINLLFDVLSKGEDITITYRGKPKAKLISTDTFQEKKDNSMFGMWRDKDDNVAQYVRSLRQGRDFAL